MFHTSLAPPPLLGPPGSAPSAGFSPQSTAISPGPLGGGRRREATLRRRGLDLCRRPLLFGPGFGFLWDYRNAYSCPQSKLSESARARSVTLAGISNPCRVSADMFPNEPARVNPWEVAWRGAVQTRPFLVGPL